MPRHRRPRDRKIHCSACLFYYAIADEFRDWLRDAKDMYLDDIEAYEAQELFAQFVDRWNAGRLDASYYSDRPRWCPTCEVMEKTLCTEAEACAALDVFDEETLAIEWIRLRRALSKLPRSPRDGSPRDVIREIGKWHPLLIPPFINDRLRRAVRKYLAGGDGKKQIVAKYGDISHWDVSQVTTMASMFYDARSFNQSINKWNVSNVRTMEGMFCRARSFNKPLSDWDVSNVTNMRSMFDGATCFNQPLANWDVSSVTNMSYMFASDENHEKFLPRFNQPLNYWNVSSVKSMYAMFFRAISFNQPLNDWNVYDVRDMKGMFYDASSFDRLLHAPWYHRYSDSDSESE